jgi:hypothetical protein
MPNVVATAHAKGGTAKPTRTDHLTALLQRPVCVGVTASGQPPHPVDVAGGTERRPFASPGAPGLGPSRRARDRQAVLVEQPVGAIALAERIAGVVASGDLRMVLITGSVARGLSDDNSDVDIYLYWHEPNVALLSDRQRFDPIGMHPEFGVPTATGWFTKLRFDDHYVDVESVDVALLADAADALGSNGPPPGWVVKVASGLRDAIAVHGDRDLGTWQRRLTYRDDTASAEASARAARLLSPTALFDLTFARGDALSFSARLSQVLLDAVAMLGAVNRRFIPTEEPKWIPWHLSQLTHCPDNVNERLHAAITRPSIDTMADLDALLEETLDLVDMYVPGTSTKSARYALRLRPRPRR